jgi:DNA-binding transcriptional ArsR family regulator
MAEPGRSDHESDDRTGILPEDSLLSLEEYLAMQRAIGNETRFRILTRLVEKGDHSARSLTTALGIESNRLHSHLDTLVDVGLVETRMRNDPSSEELYTYYRATAFGKGILDHGVRELMRREWEFREAYSESQTHD